MTEEQPSDALISSQTQMLLLDLFLLTYPQMAPQTLDSKETANSPKTGQTSPIPTLLGSPETHHNVSMKQPLIMMTIPASPSPLFFLLKWWWELIK